MLNLKVGMMPGKLTEVEIEEGTIVGEAFEMAGVTINNHDIRLDGEKVNLDKEITSGRLLVATKQIKGNSKTIKVGMMPGKLTVVNYDGRETVSELFGIAGVTIDNHDVRLDGEKVSLDTVVNNGSLLVATKQIKGNCDDCQSCGECGETKKVYIAIDVNEDEVEMLLSVPLPLELSEDMVDENCNSVVIKLAEDEEYTVDRDMFLSVYELVKVDEIIEVKEPIFSVEDDAILNPALEPTIGIVKQNYPEGYEANLELLKRELKEQRDRYQAWVEQTQMQMDVLNELEFRTKSN